MVVTGAYDGAVYRAVDGVIDAEPLYRHDTSVTTISVGGDGSVVASGDADGECDGRSALPPAEQSTGTREQ